MKLTKFSPVILTLLAYLLAQATGTLLLFATGLLTLPDVSIDLSSPLFPPIMMAVDIIAVLTCRLFLSDMHFPTPGDTATVKWRAGTLAIASGMLGAIGISVLTNDIELPDIMQQMALAMSHNLWGLLTLVIVGPLTEEILFREAIEGGMLRRGASPWTAIAVSAIAFSAAHLNLAQGLYALPFAIILGIIYHRTGNIILSSLLHILNNAIVAAQLLILGQDIADISYTKWLGSTIAEYAFMLIACLLCAILMKKFCDYYPLSQENDRK